MYSLEDSRSKSRIEALFGPVYGGVNFLKGAILLPNNEIC